MNLEWRTLSPYPAIWYLHRKNTLVGVVRRTRHTFDVYVESQTPFAQRTLVAKMPTLDEAKNLLQTLLGAQHA